MSIRFASSHSNNMRPLAFQGVLATNCYDQLRTLLERHAAFLARHGMPDAGLLLAEPMHDAQSGCIDWYTEATETPVPLADLPEAEQAAARERLARSAAAMQALFDAQGRSASGRREASGTDPMAIGLLKLALQHPSPADIYVAGGCPVLVNWGFGPGAGEAVPQDILREGTPIAPAPAAPEATNPPAPPATPPKRKVGGMGCIVCLPFLLLLLFLLLAAAGIIRSPLPSGCVARHDDATADRVEPGKATPLDEALVRPIDRANRDAGREPLTPTRSAPARGSDLEIPEDAARTNDLSFLEGCWESETGLVETSTGLPIRVEYCFDRQGRGNQYVHLSNGLSCQGQLTGRFRGDRLAMEASSSTCPDGHGFLPQEVECTGSGQTTRCTGQDQPRNHPAWNARFRRK